jgi:hypothetical protein
VGEIPSGPGECGIILATGKRESVDSKQTDLLGDVQIREAPCFLFSMWPNSS